MTLEVATNSPEGRYAQGYQILEDKLGFATLNEDFPSISPSGFERFLQRGASSTAGIVVYQPGQDLRRSVRTSYRELYDASLIKSQTLLRLLQGHQGSNIVLLHFDQHQDNVDWLWAVTLAGYIPAISVPFSSDIQQRQSHIKHLRELLKDPLVLTSATLVSHFGTDHGLNILTIQQVEKESVPTSAEPPVGYLKPRESSFSSTSSSSTLYYADEDPPAVLMLTSGSSGKSKAVSLSMHQLTSSVAGKSENWETTSRSVFLNWIGLDHVASLSEVHLHALSVCAEQVHVQANDLLQEPLLFLRLISQHSVTHTFAPNFFLALLEQRLASALEDEVQDIDLSSLKSIMSGGEANVTQTAKALAARLEALNVQQQVIRMGYGLTESSGALIYGMFDPVYEDTEKHEFASIGKPITGAMTRIALPNGAIASPHEVGSLELSGPVVFRHYFNNSEATSDAFTPDGWFKTGDMAYKDASGRINLTGRSKELLNINGVKYSPTELEAAVERMNLAELVPSYTAIFAYRAPSSQTEGYVVIYGFKGHERSIEAYNEAYLITKLLSAAVGIRPYRIIPLPVSVLDRSSLGKLSRAKLRTKFTEGAFKKHEIDVVEAIRSNQAGEMIPPSTSTEQAIVEVLSEMLDLPLDIISTHSHVFELGLTSISLFKFEQAIRKKLSLPQSISIITMLSSPLVKAIAAAIDNAQSREYDPVVMLQTRGDKLPLWLVHPVSGNVLAFLPLSRIITDRPLYALTARGLADGEELFSSVDEMAETYFKAIKKHQPQGPYALAGYSYGTTVAFELAKLLEANGDQVVFSAGIDSPPHVTPLVDGLDWTAAAIYVSYHLELVGQEDLSSLRASLAGLSQEETLQRLLSIARPVPRQRLSLDIQQFRTIVNVASNFISIAKTYRPAGKVRKFDVFYCTPPQNIERERKVWLRDYLSRWQDYSDEHVDFYECEGDHADMLNPNYIEGFKQRLNKVLTARDV